MAADAGGTLSAYLSSVTGADPAEIAALRWGDVDWLRGRLRIRVRLELRPHLALAAADERDLPVGWDTLRRLEAHRRRLVGAGAGDGIANFVFPDGAVHPIGALPSASWMTT